MFRLIKKGFFIDDYLMKKMFKVKEGKDNCLIKIWFRRSIILFEMIGFIYNVYNGRVFIFVYIIENYVGYKLGEFVFIRIFKGYKGSV